MSAHAAVAGAVPDCIFCRIAAGEIPCHKLMEDGRVLAFMDVNPVNEGHCLVIPKAHAPNLYEAPDESVAAAAAAARRVAAAVRLALDPPGINLMQANGPAAGQSVHHLHFHVIPRRADDGLPFNWEPRPGDPDAIGEIAARIRAHLPPLSGS